MKPALLLLLCLCATTAPAAIVYSGLRDIPLPTGPDGIYLDVDQGTTGTAPFTGWDINVFFAGLAIGGNVSFQPARSGTGNEDPVLRFEEGNPIGTLLFYASGETGSSTHLGAPGNFQEGVEGLLGFRFLTNPGGGPYFGWMRLTLTANTPGGVIHDWAWEDSGNPLPAGQVPEPAPLFYVVTAVAAFLSRRRN